MLGGPQSLVFIAFAERPSFNERAIGAHSRGGIDIVALRLADKGIEHRAREVSLPREVFQANDERIFVSPMKRVAGLKGDGALPAFLCDKLADFARRQHELPVVGMLRLR